MTNKIQSISIKEDFNESGFGRSEAIGSGINVGDRCFGYALPNLPVGHTLNTSRNLVVLIGDNGTGKTTLLDKIAFQFEPLEERKKYRLYMSFSRIIPDYFDVTTHNGKKPIVKFYERGEENLRTHIAKKTGDQLFTSSLKLARERYGALCSCEAVARAEEISEKHEDYQKIQSIIKSSSGQFQLNYVKWALEDSVKNNCPEVLLFDEPEAGVSMKNKERLVRMIEEYAFGDEDRQIFIATHESAFCKIPNSMIINLDEEPAKSIASEEFSIDKYLTNK